MPGAGNGAAGDRAPPGLEVNVAERFYEVSGTSASALNGALAREGPTVRGRKAQAVTEWRVSWSFVPVRRGSVCVSSQPQVRVRVVTTLPHWLDLDVAPESLAMDWSLFLERLKHHESEHQDIAMKSGRELLAVLDGLEAEDCQLLQRVAFRAAAGLESSQQALHESFDDSIDYGVTGSGG